MRSVENECNGCAECKGCGRKHRKFVQYSCDKCGEVIDEGDSLSPAPNGASEEWCNRCVDDFNEEKLMENYFESCEKLPKIVELVRSKYGIVISIIYKDRAWKGTAYIDENHYVQKSKRLEEVIHYLYLDIVLWVSTHDNELKERFSCERRFRS